MRFKLRTLLLSVALLCLLIVAGRFALQRPERRALPFSATVIRDEYNVWLDWDYTLSARIHESEFVPYVERLGLYPSIGESGVYENSDEDKNVRAWYADGIVHVEAFGN